MELNGNKKEQTLSGPSVGSVGGHSISPTSSPVSCFLSDSWGPAATPSVQLWALVPCSSLPRTQAHHPALPGQQEATV